MGIGFSRFIEKPLQDQLNNKIDKEAAMPVLAQEVFRDRITAQGWMPIDELPDEIKDNETSILLFAKNKTDKYWCVIQASWFEAQFYADSKENVIDWEDGITTATHWMPLPYLPSTGEG